MHRQKNIIQKTKIFDKIRKNNIIIGNLENQEYKFKGKKEQLLQ